MTSQLTILCDAVRGIGSTTDEIASALYAREGELRAMAAQVSIHAIGQQAPGAGASVAAFQAAAQALAQAASVLRECGKRARDFAAANCGGSSSAGAASRNTIVFEGFGQSPLDGGTLAGALDQLLPQQVFVHIGKVTFDPSRRPHPHCAGRSFVPRDGAAVRIELYGPPEVGGTRAALSDKFDELRPSLVMQTAIHEVAHVIWFRILSDEGRQRWETLCQQAYARGEKPSTDKAWNPVEDFAEAVVVYVGTPDSLRYHASERYQYVDGLFDALRTEQMAGHS